MKKKNNGVSRRSFISKASLLMGGAGLAASAKYELLNEIASKVIPKSQADEVTPKRVIEICMRSGVPVIGIGAPLAFTQQTSSIYPNSPFQGNQYIDAGNGLFLTPFANQHLSTHTANISMTQNVRLSAGQGHSQMFKHRVSDKGSPIIQLANRNPTSSMLNGVQLQRNANANLVQNDVKGGDKDLIKSNMNSFRNLFKKPTFNLSDVEVDAVTKAAQKLSRRQALMLENKVKHVVSKSRDLASAATLMKVDLSQELLVNDIQSDFVLSGNQYATEGQSLATILKSMKLNLINSAVLVFTTGDWHGNRSLTDAKIKDMNEGLAKMLDGAIRFMKATPDPAGANGETLWDTTTIVVSSEFTRRVSIMGQDNGDGGTHGALFVGKEIKGGFVGDFDLGDGSSFARPMGVGLNGEKMDQLTLTNDHMIHTMNKLCGNSSVNQAMVIKAITDGHV